MIKFNLLKESKGTTKWKLYNVDTAINRSSNIFMQSHIGLNIINTSAPMNHHLGRNNNMKIVYGNAQSGKTSYLIHESIECNYTIVCHNIEEKNRLMRQAELLDNYRFFPPPITYHEFTHGNYHGINTNGFLIDNINLFLESFRTPAPIKGITIRTYDN